MGNRLHCAKKYIVEFDHYGYFNWRPNDFEEYIRFQDSYLKTDMIQWYEDGQNGYELYKSEVEQAVVSLNLIYSDENKLKEYISAAGEYFDLDINEPELLEILQEGKEMLERFLLVCDDNNDYIHAEYF